MAGLRETLKSEFSAEQVESFERAQQLAERFPVEGGDIVTDHRTEWYSSGRSVQNIGTSKRYTTWS